MKLVIVFFLIVFFTLNVLAKLTIQSVTDTGAGTIWAAPVVLDDGTVAVAVNKGKIYFFDKYGQQTHVFDNGTVSPFFGLTVLKSGLLAAIDHRFLYLVTKKGKLFKKIKGGSYYDPIELPDGTIAFGALSFLDTKTWQVSVEVPLSQGAGLALMENGTVAIGDQTTAIYFINPRGDVEHVIPIPDYCYHLYRPIVLKNGTLVMPCGNTAGSDGVVRFIAPDYSVKKVPIEFGWPRNLLQLVDGTVVVPTGSIIYFLTRQGDIVATFDLGQTGFTGKPVEVFPGVVGVGSTDTGKFYLIGKDGKLVDSIQLHPGLPRHEWRAGSALMKNGNIVAAGMDGKIYILKP